MKKRSLVALVVSMAVVLAAAVAFAQAPPPEYGAPISLEQAKKIMAGAEAEATKNKWPVVITILDSGGQLVMLQRLDNAQWGSVDISKEKARAAVALRRPTKALQDLDRSGRRQPAPAQHRVQRARGRDPDHRRRQDHRLGRCLGRDVEAGRADRSGRDRQPGEVGEGSKRG